MSINRTIRCDCCGVEQIETMPDAGWAGWGAIYGVALNGASNPNVCPVCLSKVMEFVEKEVCNGMD